MPVWLPCAVENRSSSGRFCSESVVILNSSSEPWIGPWPEALLDSGSTSPGGTSTPVWKANGLMSVSIGIGRYTLSSVSTISQLLAAGSASSVLVLDAHPDAEPRLVAARRCGALGQALQVLAILDVVRRSCSATSRSGT